MLPLSIFIAIIFAVYLKQRENRKVEGFAIISAIKTLAQTLNNIRRAMSIMNSKIFKQITNLNKKTKTFRNKILKNKLKIVKSVKKSKKVSDQAIKAQIQTEQSKQSQAPGIISIFLPFIGMYSSKLKTIVTVLLAIKTALMNSPEDIANSLFAMLGNVKDHLTMENAGILILYPLMTVILLAQLSETISIMLSIEDNLIMTSLTNFIFVSIITFVSILFTFKYKNKLSMEEAFKKISIKELLIKTFWITLQVNLLYYQLSGTLFRVINRITSGNTILYRLLKIKNSLLMGILHLIISLLHPIYKPVKPIKVVKKNIEKK